MNYKQLVSALILGCALNAHGMESDSPPAPPPPSPSGAINARAHCLAVAEQMQIPRNIAEQALTGLQSRDVGTYGWLMQRAGSPTRDSRTERRIKSTISQAVITLLVERQQPPSTHVVEMSALTGAAPDGVDEHEQCVALALRSKPAKDHPEKTIREALGYMKANQPARYAKVARSAQQSRLAGAPSIEDALNIARGIASLKTGNLDAAKKDLTSTTSTLSWTRRLGGVMAIGLILWEIYNTVSKEWESDDNTTTAADLSALYANLTKLLTNSTTT